MGDQDEGIGYALIGTILLIAAIATGPGLVGFGAAIAGGILLLSALMALIEGSKVRGRGD